MSASKKDASTRRRADTSSYLERIACHLDVPVSAFLHPEGMEPRGDLAASPIEGVPELIHLYAGLDPDGRTAVLALARSLARP